MSIARQISNALGGELSSRGKNSYNVPGPGHSKADRSLSVSDDPSNPEGFVVFSFKGDDPLACRDYVRSAAGLPAWQPAARREPTAPEFVYRDEKGEPYLRVTKVYRDGKKSFYQHKWTGTAWTKGNQQVRIPYRLPDVIASDTVYIVEGEKDAERLGTLGLVATSCPEGAGKWRAELCHWFDGKHVIILADNDEAGRKHAEQVEEALRANTASCRAVHFPMLPEKGDVSDWLDLGKTKADLLAYVAGQAPAVEAQKERFALDWFHEIADSMPKETFIKGVLGVNEFTMLSGKPGSGKSVITTDMACHVAAGMEWQGRRVKQGLVVYIAAERRDLTKRRMLAFRKRHGIGNIPLLIVGGAMNLTAGFRDADDIAAMIKRAEEACGHSCTWIIVDTLTRTFGPGDQNASVDMVRFIQSCDRIRESVVGSHVTVIHHTGWAGDRGKGAIDLDGAVDASFLVKKEASSYVLECDGTNDGDEGVICHFKMESVQVGIDEDGQPTMAPVVVASGGMSAGDQMVSNLKKHDAKALEVLGHEGGSATEDAWRKAFYAAYPGIAINTLKTRFLRARSNLIGSGAVHKADDAFHLASAQTAQTAQVPCADTFESEHPYGTIGTHPLGCAAVPVFEPIEEEIASGEVQEAEQLDCAPDAVRVAASDLMPRGPSSELPENIPEVKAATPNLSDAKVSTEPDIFTEADVPLFLRRGAS